ncbi:MAG: methionyl-tRNA formyltransferase [Planctomycetales bacterium]|nr:methionyl-tRNA formyltransferase [Planctomycetales bacterium]
MRIIALGTGPFAVPTLRRLAADGHEVLLVVTRPPRGRRAPPAPMQVAADELQLPLWQPETVNEPAAVERLASLAADLLVVCDYGEILKPPALAAARLGGINLHGSLLPRYRGAAPVQWAVLNGDAETGNTVIHMTPRLDAGPCLGVQRVPIDPDETAGELEARLAAVGAELAAEVVGKLAAGTAESIPQDPAAATKAPRLTKEHGAIDWSRSAVEIKNQVRGLQPWPRAYTDVRRAAGGEPLRLIVHQAAVAGPAEAALAAPGTVVATSPGLIVATGAGPLELVSVQAPGKRAMPAADFLRGYPLAAGDLMGQFPAS